jgi:hypothetical protein
MVTNKYREEVLNVILAEVLDEQGIVSTPEQIIKHSKTAKKMPDVIVLYQGLRTVIEGKVDDAPSAKEAVLKNARDRVDQGIAHIGVSVVYPSELRSVDFHSLKDTLKETKLQISTYSEAGTEGWTIGDPGYLGAMLRRTFEALVDDDVLNQAIEVLEQGIEIFAKASTAKPGTANRLAKALGIGEPPKLKDLKKSSE